MLTSIAALSFRHLVAGSVARSERFVPSDGYRILPSTVDDARFSTSNPIAARLASGRVSRCQITTGVLLSTAFCDGPLRRLRVHRRYRAVVDTSACGTACSWRLMIMAPENAMRRVVGSRGFARLPWFASSYRSPSAAIFYPEALRAIRYVVLSSLTCSCQQLDASSRSVQSRMPSGTSPTSSVPASPMAPPVLR